MSSQTSTSRSGADGPPRFMLRSLSSPMAHLGRERLREAFTRQARPIWRCFSRSLWHRKSLLHFVQTKADCKIGGARSSWLAGPPLVAIDPLRIGADKTNDCYCTVVVSCLARSDHTEFVLNVWICVHDLFV